MGEKLGEKNKKFVVNQDEVRSKFGKSALAVLKIIAEDPGYSSAAIAEKINLSQRGVQKIFAKLKENNLIKRVGSDKTGHWKIINNLE